MDTQEKNQAQSNDITESEAKELEELFDEKKDTGKETDPNKKEEEKGSKENLLDEGKKEDKGKWDEEDKDKDLDWELKKQSANAQRKIQEKHNRILEVETKLVERSPERFLELASWSDDDKKIAKEIARKLYNTSLEEAIKELSWEDLDPEKKAELLADEKIRKKENEKLKDSFFQEKEILNKNSEKFNEETFNNFLDNYQRLIGNEASADSEEITKRLEEAYFLATRESYEEEIKEKTREEIKLETAKKKISSSWSDWGSQWKENKKDEWDWLNGLDSSN